MGRLTPGAPADPSAGAQLVAFAGVVLALLASPLIGVPVAAAVGWMAWRRSARRLANAIAVLILAYAAWLMLTTPV